MVNYIKAHHLEGVWPTSEKVLVGINASPYAGQLVRAAYRLALNIDARIIVLHIETDEDKSFSEEKRRWLKNAFDVAERLGIQTITVHSTDFSTKISTFVLQNGITRIVLGKPHESGKFSSVDSILAKTEGVDMYIFAGRGDSAQKDQASGVTNPVTEMLKRIRQMNKKVTYMKKVNVKVNPDKYQIQQDRKACIGCGVCTTICPENWVMADDGKSMPLETEVDEIGCNQDAANSCPVGCIKIVKKGGSNTLLS